RARECCHRDEFAPDVVGLLLERYEQRLVPIGERVEHELAKERGLAAEGRSAPDRDLARHEANEVDRVGPRQRKTLGQWRPELSDQALGGWMLRAEDARVSAFAAQLEQPVVIIPSD